MVWIKGQLAFNKKEIPNRDYLKQEVQNRIKNIESNFLENIIDVFYEKTKDIENYHDKNIYSVKGFVPFISTEILKINQYNNKPHQLEYWSIRGWSEIEAEKRRLKRTKEWYIKEFGLEVGTEKWNKYTRAYTPKSHKQQNRINRKEKRISKKTGTFANTLSDYIEIYGEEYGKIKYEKFCKNSSRNLQWFKQRYGEELGFEKWNNKANKLKKTLDEYIKQHGVALGTYFYNKQQIRFIKRRIKHGRYVDEDRKQLVKLSFQASKKSLKIFLPLIEQIKTEPDDIQIGYCQNEFEISPYKYDFVIKSKKLIIEFNGVKYHANPKWSEKRLKKWRQIYTNENAFLNIERFNDKLKLAEDNGYKVLVLWSDTSTKKNIEIAKNFIENN